MKVSIIMAYYNRKKLLYRTLTSISKSVVKDIEVIVVDDASSEGEKINDLTIEFPFLKVITVDIKDKWYSNPCVPLNIGIKKAIGEILVLQNPECMYLHDVLNSIIHRVTKENYLSISTYNVDEKFMENIDNRIESDTLLGDILNLPQIGVGDNKCGWYNHSKFRPTHYNFCSAITKKNMDKLNGFDERYANGIAFDDSEFISRVGFLGLNKEINDDVIVLHQYHSKIYDNNVDVINLRKKNKNLLNYITLREKKYRVN